MVSSKDKSVTVFEDGHEVAKGKATIAGGNRPIGEGVYTLTGSSKVDDSLTWSGTGYGKTDREDMGHELRRISADPPVREHIRKRMKTGITVVTTDQSHSVAQRASDFTVFEGVY
ncbi:MAG: hypothetical protein RJA94_2731 [Pseudomonadota bacterium]|jgi:hypothetical protein